MKRHSRSKKPIIAEPEPEPEAPDAGIPTQSEYDRDVLRQTVAKLRGELANAKLNYAAAHAQTPGAGHPRSGLADVAKVRKLLDLTERLLQDGLPEPVQGKVIELPTPDRVIELPIPDGLA